MVSVGARDSAKRRCIAAGDMGVRWSMTGSWYSDWVEVFKGVMFTWWLLVEKGRKGGHALSQPGLATGHSNGGKIACCSGL